MANEIGAKIESYAKAHLQELKQEENKTGKKLTKYDIAQLMLSSGQLKEADFAKWMSTQEGVNAQTISAQQKAALQSGNVWGVAGYMGGEESYLESLVSFSDKTPFEQNIEVLSPRANKLAESIAERKRQSEEMRAAIAQQNLESRRITSPEDAEDFAKEIAFYDYVKSQPDIDVNYKDLMFDIEFQKADKKQQVEMLLDKTGELFYEAKEVGNKAAMKELLMQGLGLTFAYMDNKAGITDAKDLIKKYSGLNALVEAVDKFVDDGDIDNLSFMEKAWETTKGVGDAVDSFIGTQGAAFVGVLALASEAAAAAGIGQVFSGVTQGYFAYEGGKLVIDGSKNVYNADTAEEARMGGQELGTGAIMLGGAAKSFQVGRSKAKINDAIKANRARAEKEIDALLAERKNIHETNNTNNGLVNFRTGETVINKAELANAYQENPELVGRLLKSTQEYTKYVGSEHLHYDMVVPSYSTEAVVTIARYGKTNPEALPLLERALSHSENIKDVAQLELIAKECINNPQKVENFLNTKVSASLYYNSTDAYNSFDHYMAIRLYNVLKEGTPADLLSKIKPEASFDLGGEPVVVYRMPKETTINTADYGIDAYAGDLVLRRGNSYEVLPAKERLNGDNYQGRELGKAYFQAVKEGKLIQNPEVGAPSNYRARLETPDYSDVRLKFPADAIPTQTKPGKATAYTTTYEPDGIVYRGADGKLYVPNKWNPESPHEVKPNSVIMIYDRAGGDFAVGEPTVIAKTYRNPATNQVDPLYDVKPGIENAIEIQKDIVPSAFKVVPEGTVVKTKEAPEGVTVKEGQAVMYDIDGDPYVVDIKKTLLKRQEPVGDAAKAAFDALKEGKPVQTSTSADKPQLSPELKASLLNALEEMKPEFDSSIVINKINKNPEFVARLAEYKTPDGKPLFSLEEINSILANCEVTQKAFDYIENPKYTNWFLESQNRAFVLWKLLYY